MGYNAAVQLLDRHGDHLGGGVLLTSYLVVTANHCVSRMNIGDSLPLLVGGVAAQGTLVERAADHDLALLEIDRPLRPIEPKYARRGDAWFGPIRRSLSDPELAGTVRNRVEYECQSGGRLMAVQLTTDVDIGEYRGYSGGPVLKLPDEDPSVLGILLEQLPDGGSIQRNTSTLFAACISEAFRLLHALSTAWLIFRLLDLRPGDVQSAQETTTRKYNDGEETVFDVAVETLSSSMIDADSHLILRARVSETAVESYGGGE